MDKEKAPVGACEQAKRKTEKALKDIEDGKHTISQARKKFGLALFGGVLGDMCLLKKG